MTVRDLRSLFAAVAGADPRCDADLLAAADPAAFAELVRRHGPLVWGTARRLLPEADAADAFQAVFLALHRSRRRLRDPAVVGGWLHTATVRAARAVRRGQARQRGREERAARPEATAPVADAAWGRMLVAVHEKVERLPAGERAAFVMCELQGVPAGEAAVRLGWKPGTLTGRLSKARAKLVARLTARGVAPAVGLAGVGTLTVPAAVAGRAGELAAVPSVVAALSREVTAMAPIKHLAAVMAVAGGLAAGLGGYAVRADGGPPPVAVAPPPRPVTPPLYFPTEVGTRWSYRYPTGDPIEYTVLLTQAKGDEVVVSVGRVRKDGHTLNRKVAVSAKGVYQLGSVAYVSRQGFRPDDAPVHWEEWRDDAAPVCLFNATVQPGEAWPDGLGPKAAYRTVGRETVTVPTGTFEAVVFDHTRGKYRYRHWYAEGAGAVKWTIDDGTKVQEVVMTAFSRPD